MQVKFVALSGLPLLPAQEMARPHVGDLIELPHGEWFEVLNEPPVMRPEKAGFPERTVFVAYFHVRHILRQVPPDHADVLATQPSGVAAGPMTVEKALEPTAPEPIKQPANVTDAVYAKLTAPPAKKKGGRK